MSDKRIKGKGDAYAVAHAVGWQAGRHSMLSHQRTQWTFEDWDAAADAFARVYDALQTQRLHTYRVKVGDARTIIVDAPNGDVAITIALSTHTQAQILEEIR